jgi:hypothetical protein
MNRLAIFSFEGGVGVGVGFIYGWEETKVYLGGTWIGNCLNANELKIW